MESKVVVFKKKQTYESILKLFFALCSTLSALNTPYDLLLSSPKLSRSMGVFLWDDLD